jgi:hypothetical protein
MLEPIAPRAETLAKYGLTLEAWRQLVKRQGGVCAICRTLPKTQRLCIDHVHVRGWAAMEPGARALFVRGLLCFFCNKYYCGRAITVRKARNLVEYLEQEMPFNVARDAA